MVSTVYIEILGPVVIASSNLIYTHYYSYHQSFKPPLNPLA